MTGAPTREVADRPRRPWIGWTMVGLALAGGLVVTLLLWLLFYVNCFDGDGGAPYVARDSPRADVCGFAGDRAHLAIPLAGIAGAALLIAAARRWGRGALRKFLLGVALVLPSVLPLGVTFLLGLPSAHCSDEQLAANERARGAPPYDCEAY